MCWLRLDFEDFTTAGPSLTDETSGGVCVDSFTVTVTFKILSMYSVCTVWGSGMHVRIQTRMLVALRATHARRHCAFEVP